MINKLDLVELIENQTRLYYVIGEDIFDFIPHIDTNIWDTETGSYICLDCNKGLRIYLDNLYKTYDDAIDGLWERKYKYIVRPIILQLPNWKYVNEHDKTVVEFIAYNQDKYKLVFDRENQIIKLYQLSNKLHSDEYFKLWENTFSAEHYVLVCSVCKHLFEPVDEDLEED